MARLFMVIVVLLAAFSAVLFFAGCASTPRPVGVSVDATEAGIEACITLARKNGCACPADAGTTKPEASAPVPDASIVGR